MKYNFTEWKNEKYSENEVQNKWSPDRVPSWSIRQSIGNILANARDNPQRWFGKETFDHLLQLSRTDAPPGAEQFVRQFQTEASYFLNAVRKYMHYKDGGREGGYGVSYLVAPTDRNDPNFQAYQRAWENFSKESSARAEMAQKQGIIS